MAEYVHGFTASEQARLSAMQDILNDAVMKEMDLTGVRRILDVGAGLGQFTRRMAQAAGAGSVVVGVERDARQREEAMRQAEAEREANLFEMREGDAEALPLTRDELGSFDLSHCRFLLEHVPDPLAVVRQMVQATRPGGKIVLLDDDHELLRFSPDLPEVDRAWRIYWESYRDRGTDPLVGRRLPELLVQAGAIPTRVATVFYGAVSAMELFDPVVNNLIGVLEGAAEDLDRRGLFSPAEMKHALERLEDWRSTPGAVVWYSLPFVEGRRPE